jgi:hypothetical protein
MTTSEAIAGAKHQISVIVPTSPVPAHPDTDIIEETIASIRHWLPDVEIFLTFDGLPPDHYHRHDQYEEYIRRTLWLADHGGWGPIFPEVFTSHHHQSGMMRRILGEITTPLVLYVEHDAPLVTDEPIDFPAIAAFIAEGRSSLVRLHHEAVIPPDHHHMMHGDDGGFLRTSQWSQRPHLATTAFYNRIMEAHFPWSHRVFIEDQMHGVVDNAYRQHGLNGWQQYRLHIYQPPGDNLKRSYHLDGRKGYR